MVTYTMALGYMHDTCNMRIHEMFNVTDGQLMEINLGVDFLFSLLQFLQCVSKKKVYTF